MKTLAMKLPIDYSHTQAEIIGRWCRIVTHLLFEATHRYAEIRHTQDAKAGFIHHMADAQNHLERVLTAYVNYLLKSSVQDESGEDTLPQDYVPEVVTSMPPLEMYRDILRSLGGSREDNEAIRKAWWDSVQGSEKDVQAAIREFNNQTQMPDPALTEDPRPETPPQRILSLLARANELSDLFWIDGWLPGICPGSGNVCWSHPQHDFQIWATPTSEQINVEIVWREGDSYTPDPLFYTSTIRGYLSVMQDVIPRIIHSAEEWRCPSLYVLVEETNGLISNTNAFRKLEYALDEYTRRYAKRYPEDHSREAILDRFHKGDSWKSGNGVTVHFFRVQA